MLVASVLLDPSLVLDEPPLELDACELEDISTVVDWLDELASLGSDVLTLEVPWLDEDELAAVEPA